MTEPPNFGQTLIVVLPSILAFLTAALAAILAYLARRGASEASGKISDLHTVVNSRLDSLIEATRLNAHAAGVAEGTKSERKRADDLLLPPPGYVPDARASG
jgi:hypothetical protein